MAFGKKSVRADGQIICDYLKPAILVTSWTREDPARRFHGWNEGRCRFSVWEDPPMCYRSKIVIPELKNRCDKLEMEVSELMLMVEFLSEKVLHSDKPLSFFLNHLVRGGRGSCFLVVRDTHTLGWSSENTDSLILTPFTCLVLGGFGGLGAVVATLRLEVFELYLVQILE
ncbi:hypothetical protein BUALT_Bualt12G0127600 [Buddleja alternifolia]|uniref:Uncharacterized protein n=1 Tax=Buddleja alternifolia TaxID=168488 RepID=A0AAV6WY28_9LAMI|nr:hypothetical protein BUALT_Bualt12G0127600 [Buddleja alternifolia]